MRDLDKVYIEYVKCLKEEQVILEDFRTACQITGGNPACRRRRCDNRLTTLYLKAHSISRAYEIGWPTVYA
jgi:hypothetical protein